MAMWTGLVLVAFLTATLDINGCHGTDLGPMQIPERSQKFFLGGKEPVGITGDNCRVIEQTLPSDASYNKGPFYVTMYDTKIHSAVYSANRLLPGFADNPVEVPRRPFRWRVIPDLPSDKQVYEAKANMNITRGHLNPINMNMYSMSAVKSTFSYANAVPLFRDFNSGSWRKFETKLLGYAKICTADNTSTVHFITGPADFRYDGKKKVLSTEETIIYSDDRKYKLRVPPVVWTAVCCLKIGGEAESLGVIGLNKKAAADAVTYEDVGLINLQILLGPGVLLFPGDKNGACEKKTAKLPVLPEN